MADQTEDLTSEYLNGFKSWSDYEYFRRLVEHRTEFESIPVRSHYSNVGHVEFWFRDKRSNRVWRLVEPDAPFRGLWAVVPANELQ